jgi:hypothetical protein
MWKNTYGRAGEVTDDSIIRRMCLAYWITKAIDTDSKFVILIAFPLQEWLYECASVLGYTYIVCAVTFQKEMYVKVSGFLDCDAVSLG